MVEPSEVLFDTDILSEIIKRRNAFIVQRANAYALHHDILTFTSITVFEILRGLHAEVAPVQIARAKAIFARNREIVPDRADYRLAAEIVGALDQRGTPIGVADPLIAACALNRDLPLATGNLGHYGYVVDAGFPVRLEGWRQV